MLTALLAMALNAAPAQLTVEVKPPETEVIIDGKKKGRGTKPLVVKLTPGRHRVRVVYKGDAHEEEVVIKAGEKATWKWEFEGGKQSPAEAPVPAEGEAPTAP